MNRATAGQDFYGILIATMQTDNLLSLLHEALVHLYEPGVLQAHPLAGQLAAEVAPAQRGQHLHRRLRQAIEQLRPPPGTPEHALAWRTYRFLTLRYVHALTLQQVAAEFGLTERHCRRVQREALLQLARLLLTPDLAPPETGPALEAEALLESEVARVGAVREPPASLHQTIRGVIRTLEPLSVALGLRIEVRLDPTGDLTVDRMALRQILLNLLVHAFHLQPRAPICLETCLHPPPGCIRITVAEIAQPPPWPDEHMRLAERLAAMSGAALRLESTATALAFTITPAGATVRTVLLIDDNPDFLQLFHRYLRGSRYRALTAGDAETAWRLIRAERPAVITLDVLMPQQDGWELLQTLKHHRLTRHIPVIVCSVLRDRDLALALGADEFLAKPVTQAMLLAALDRCCARGGALESHGPTGSADR